MPLKYFIFVSFTNLQTMLDSTEIQKLGYRIKERDRAAFHTLYTEFFAQLQAYARRFVYDNQDAQDIVQDAYLTLWTNPDNYNPAQSILSYLLVIVKNSCYNYLRGLKIRDNHQDKIVEAILFSNIEDPEIDEALKQRLNQILIQIPAKGQQILMAHVLEHKKVKEIADQLGVAESTVKTHLKRVMRTLRENLCFIIFGL